ncbi:MAG: PaaI family thioesterase [Acidimicrobiia bacterium]|nr:MAG: PaaI family thioesterase [Acidimicrobiia bacterium]
MAAMVHTIAIQDTYPEDARHCYGCGNLNEHGYQIKTRQDDDSTITDFEPESQHMAFAGITYGGLIASVIDCHSAGSAAIFAMQKAGTAVGSEPSPRYVTAHLEVDYLAPTPLARMRIVGRLVEITDRKAIVESELFVDGNVTAKALAVLVRIRNE